MNNSKKTTSDNSKKLTLDSLKVQSFVTNLNAENEKHLVGGAAAAHPTHTAYSDVHAGKPCGC